MRFEYSLTFALMPALSFGALHLVTVVNDRAGGPDGTNTCGSSSFAEIVSFPVEKRALVDDCRILQQQVVQGNHQWVVPVSGREIVRHKTCGFNAAAKGSPGIIGNGDVNDLINDSIKRFATEGGHISAKGKYKLYTSGAGAMGCDIADGTPGAAVEVDWSVVGANADSGDDEDKGKKGDGKKKGDDKKKGH